MYLISYMKMLSYIGAFSLTTNPIIDRSPRAFVHRLSGAAHDHSWFVVILTTIRYTPLFEARCDPTVSGKKATTKPWCKFLIRN